MVVCKLWRSLANELIYEEIRTLVPEGTLKGASSTLPLHIRDISLDWKPSSSRSLPRLEVRYHCYLGKHLNIIDLHLDNLGCALPGLDEQTDEDLEHFPPPAHSGPNGPDRLSPFLPCDAHLNGRLHGQYSSIPTQY